MRAMDQAACRIDHIARRRMRNVAAIGSNAITARCDPYNLVCVVHSAPCPRRGKQSTGDFILRFRGGRIFALYLRRQAIFVVA